jgi:cytochrome c-type biogenesis protein CcmH/NrfG
MRPRRLSYLGRTREDEEDTMRARKWVLVGGLAVVLAVPAGMGVALAQWRGDHQAQRLAHRQEMLQRSGSS